MVITTNIYIKRIDLNICALLCRLRLKFGLTEPYINRLDINSTKNIMREMVVYLFLPDDGVEHMTSIFNIVSLVTTT
jgi:hypothetical protein